MASEKRFNIWVAYSDLFSNLAVFLFISAFGMFAAIGTGNGTVPASPAQQQCPQRQLDFGRALTEPGWSGAESLLGPSQYEILNEHTCAEDFELHDVGFPAVRPQGMPENFSGKMSEAIATVQDIVDRNGRKLRGRRDEILLHQLCDQLWAAATRRDLEDMHGHIVLLASASRSSAICRPDYNRPPNMADATTVPPTKAAVDELFLRCDDQSAASALTVNEQHDCQRLPPDFRRCIERSKGSLPCQRTRNQAIRDLDPIAFDREDCLDKFATKRAQSLYNYCRESVRSDDFHPDYLLNAPGTISPSASSAVGQSNYETLRTIWLERVRYRGLALDQTLRLAPKPKSNPIFLTVQFEAQAPAAR